MPFAPRSAFALTLALLMLLLSGCATLTKGECLTGDWYEIGKLDGLHGAPHARLAEHVKACSKHAVTVDAGVYDAGRLAGLARYCTRASGFQSGRAGAAYQGVCSGAAEVDFLSGYRPGYAIHAAEQRVRESQDALADIERRLEADDELDAKERKRLRRQRTDQRTQLGLAQKELRRALDAWPGAAQ